MRGIGAILVIIGILGILVWGALRIVFGVQFSLNCNQYLERAGTANTVELAKSNLEPAIKCLEAQHLTNGIVSIFLHQPGNDIGFFYSNLKASYEELEKVNKDTTQLEKSNILIKLRESLLSHTKEGTHVVCPTGISIYPYNALFFWLVVVSSILVALGVFFINKDSHW